MRTAKGLVIDIGIIGAHVTSEWYLEKADGKGVFAKCL
jgi:hypothetical protein